MEGIKRALLETEWPTGQPGCDIFTGLMAARILDAETITFHKSGHVSCCINCEDGTGSASLVRKSSLDAVKEDLKEVEDNLQFVQDPARRERLQDERRQLRAELRRLQEIPGAYSSTSTASN